MNRRAAGVMFCCISAFLFSSRYICAAIQNSGKTSWSSGQIRRSLTGLGLLQFLGVVALIAGIVYLVITEIQEAKSKSKIDPKE